MSKEILFFADRLPPFIGGVETHAHYFIQHFTKHIQFPLAGIITKDAKDRDCVVTEGGLQEVNIQALPDLFHPSFLFFNSGRWIEELPHMRHIFQEVIFLYRTGGNEILKAPLAHQQIPDHRLRQLYWSKNINSTIDLMITNSAYTEKRLRKVGLRCPFKRCIGGVNAAALKPLKPSIKEAIIIFCAARFVPYKNHFLLLSVIKQLVSRGHKLQLRLAGDGPLLEKAQKQVIRENLTAVVQFLGVLDNEKVCREIAQAHIYMQLSGDQFTEVPGGSYIHAEGMGRSILEALTAGTFVVAGRSGALDEIVTEDRGLLVDLSHAEQITNIVERVIRHLPERRAFSDRYSWENVFTFYEELLRDLDENIASYRKM